MKTIINILTAFFIIGILGSCNGFLDEYSEDEVRPSELTDLEQLLLGEGYLDAGRGEGLYNIMDIFTDDIQCNGLNSESWRSYFEGQRWRFLWDENMFNGTGGGYDANVWELPYEKILGCNIVLGSLDEMAGSEELRENLRGEALVLRAYYYLMLVNMYGMPYNEGDPSKNLGVPLKLTMDIRDEKLPRNTVKEVYEQIEKDLLLGNQLLTKYNIERNFLRINHLAAKALLSRMYLYMENWDKALAYADSVLALKPALLDLNSLAWTGMPMTPESRSVYSTETPTEVIWMRAGARISDDIIYGNPSFVVSQELLDLYGFCNNTMVMAKTIEDIRATLYFNWSMNFSPSGLSYNRRFMAIGGCTDEVYQGIRTAEMYLNRAEVYIRKFQANGDAAAREKALADLNELRRHRLNSMLQVKAVNITDAEELFAFYQDERRRELAGDGQHRWCDLRRYGMPEIVHVAYEKSTDNKTEVTLTKNRYVLPIPEEIIRVNPLLEQNK